jgi:hypothetical protein
LKNRSWTPVQPVVPMKVWSFPAALLALALGCGGCATSYAVQPYQATVNAYADMRALKTAPEHGVRVGRFKMVPDASELPLAPGANVETPDGATFATYLHDALVSELQTAGVYSEAAPVMLTGVVEQIRFAPARPQGEWHIVVTVYSSNGISIQIDERRDSPEGAPDAFMPAVQDLIAKLVQDPRFGDLVRS